MFKDLKTAIKWVTGIILGIIGIIVTLSGLLSTTTDMVSKVISIIFGIVLIIFGLFLFSSFGSKCPSCKKHYALKDIGEEIISKEEISVLVETNTKNRNGDVIGTQEQYVPGLRITYKVNKKCNNCGFTTYSTYTKDVPKV